jgi:hypothetical protein
VFENESTTAIRRANSLTQMTPRAARQETPYEERMADSFGKDEEETPLANYGGGYRTYGGKSSKRRSHRLRGHGCAGSESFWLFSGLACCNASFAS